MKVLVVASDSAENALFNEEIFIKVVSGVGKENAGGDADHRQPLPEGQG